VIHETSQDYKTRVMDPVSPSFCGAKWLNSTIWLGQGRTASCHHPAMHVIDPTALVADPSAIHNTSVKKIARREMLDGIRPDECDYCWKIEDLGQISDRVYKTLQFDDAAIAAIASADPQIGVSPRTLEVSFDRTCQFACTYCSPAFSTTWVKDIRTNGAYTGLESDGNRHFATTADYAQRYAPEDNPYIKAFWRWWPELSQTLEEIRITGGEPLMAADVWRLLDWFAENPHATIRFGINTNLGAKPELIDRLIVRTRDLHHFEIFTSNEAHGAQAEYIRDGLDYAQWLSNMRRMLDESNLKLMNIMMTINATCLFSLTDFLDDIAVLKREYGAQAILFSANILRHPSFQSVAVLPRNLRLERALALERWTERHAIDYQIGSFEVSHLQRLIEYLRAETDKETADKMPAMRRDFKRFHREYDKRRGKSFETTFPADLVAWYGELE
jgi:organic radical activating enzyme